MNHKPRVEIRYCSQCRWLLRAAWVAQELLSTFDDSLGEVALIPTTGGTFQVAVDDQRVWCRKEENGFPSMKMLKQRVRDLFAPGRPLGHVDGGHRGGH